MVEAIKSIDSEPKDKKDILIVITSQRTIGDTDKPTGFHFAELTHAYDIFANEGYNPTVASPLGGESQITSKHPEDPLNAQYLDDPEKRKLWEQTEKLDDVVDRDFRAVYVVGGHGAMFDLPGNEALSVIMNKTYKNGGVLGAVCHGPAAFVGLKDDNGEYIVKGKKINGFTNVEEMTTPYMDDMPFLIEDELTKQGGIFEKSGPRVGHVVEDARIVTGQNPESIELVVNAMHQKIKEIDRKVD